MNEYERLAQRIIAAREAQGWNQREAARQLGMDVNSLWRWENARPTYPPDPALMRDFERVLGITRREVFEILGYYEPEVPEPGVAYVIREDDPRSLILYHVEGLANRDIESVSGAVGIMADAIRRGYSDAKRDHPSEQTA